MTRSPSSLKYMNLSVGLFMPAKAFLAPSLLNTFLWRSPDLTSVSSISTSVLSDCSTSTSMPFLVTSLCFFALTGLPPSLTFVRVLFPFSSMTSSYSTSTCSFLPVLGLNTVSIFFLVILMTFLPVLGSTSILWLSFLTTVFLPVLGSVTSSYSASSPSSGTSTLTVRKASDSITCLPCLSNYLFTPSLPTFSVTPFFSFFDFNHLSFQGRFLNKFGHLFFFVLQLFFFV
mmetsp:Transcript_80073/g.173087  ORF Transcript_80073/g.173087 Transcript_80073/m.173087 type:complete len:230 (-) Transcript_80073:141-830(-)